MSEVLRPVGPSRWGMAIWLALGLGAILGVTAAVGRPALGSALGLGFVLTAVPSLPVAWRPALVTMGVRGLAILVGATLAVLTSEHPLALAVVTVAAAAGGALSVEVGPTAALAVVLIAIDVPHDPGAASLVPYLVGVLVVPVAWSAWYGCTVVFRRRGLPAPSSVRSGAPWRERRPHAIRVGIAVAVAVGVAGLLPDDLVGGHWLVTSVVLTVQPVARETGLRLAQRLSGNTVGALIAALMLGTHPSLPVVAVLTVVLFTLAMALRPVNYTWWAVTGPPVLLVISEYPALFPWYEGGVRLAMNLVGAVIVLLVVFGAPALGRLGHPDAAPDFPQRDSSDSVYKIQSRRS